MPPTPPPHPVVAVAVVDIIVAVVGGGSGGNVVRIITVITHSRPTRGGGVGNGKHQCFGSTQTYVALDCRHNSIFNLLVPLLIT